jgi:hypothetical protein
MKRIPLNFVLNLLILVHLVKIFVNYKSYGYHVSNNSYFLCYEQENIQKMFHKLRHYEDLSSEEFTVKFSEYF